MIRVALPVAIGMELGSIMRMRLVGAEFVETGAAWVLPQPAASSASKTAIRFISQFRLTAVAPAGRGMSTSIFVPAPRTDLILRAPPT